MSEGSKTVTAICAFVGMMTLALIIAFVSVSKYKTMTDFNQKFVGCDVVIQHDTLLITRYDIGADVYYLSNGTSITPDLARKKLIAKTK